MSETLDTLSIKVNTNAGSAAKGIDKLAESLKKLKADEAAQGFKQLSDVMGKLSDTSTLGEISSALKTMSKLTISDSVAQSIRNISGAINEISSEGLDKMKTLTELLKNMHNVASAARASKSALSTQNAGMQSTTLLPAPDNALPKWFEKIKAGLQGIKKLTYKPLSNPFEKVIGGANTLLGALKRIAFYRLARTVIKAITTAAKEGVSNLYGWSQAYNGAILGGRSFSSIMDRAAESVLYLKNAFGSALAPVIASLEPILYKLADAVVFVVNKFNELWAVLRGDSSYTAAIRKTTEFSKETGKAAKAVQNLVFGFDELNIIPAKSGGGGGAATDYSNMFEDRLVEAEGFVRKLGEKLQEITADFKIKWENFKTGFGFNKETVAKVIVAGLKTLLGTTVGFTLAGAPGALVGTLTGLSLGLSATNAIFNNDSTLSTDELFNSLANILTNLVWAGVFSNVGGKLGVLVYAALSIGLSTGFFDKALSAITANGLKDSLATIITGVGTGILFWKVFGSGADLFGLTVGTLLSFALRSNNKIFDGKGINWDDGLSKLEALILAGTVGLLTWVFTKDLTTATLAFNLTLSIMQIDWSNLLPALKEAFERAKAEFKFQLDNFGRWMRGEETLQRVIDVNTGKITYSDGRVEWEAPRKKKSLFLSSEGVGGGAFAEGGSPVTGSIFLAGEQGPEFVGQIGGHTQVYNEDQLANSLSAANEELINVILQVANNLIGAVNSKDLTVNIGDREIANSAQRGARLNGRAMVV